MTICIYIHIYVLLTWDNIEGMRMATLDKINEFVGIEKCPLTESHLKKL